ncbi:protein of unknown function [Burkholderia multivorans]
MTTYLTEAAEWSEGIRQLETSDPVQGGPDGVDNIAPQQLANRTAYLKKEIEDTQAALVAATKPATEAVQGTAKVASQAIVDAGNDDAAIVTSKKLATRLAALLKQATETVLGLAKVATQDQVAAGTDDATIVTPKKLVAAITSTLSKQATEADLGSAKIATQALVDAGTDDATIVTPKKLTVRLKQATEAILGLAKVATQDQVTSGADDATIVTPKKLAAFHAPVNNTATSSDLALLPGQSAYIDFAGAMSVPLHIATGDNQLYEIEAQLLGNTGAAANTLLLPNNASYTNSFVGICNTNGVGNSYSGYAAYINGFLLAYLQDARHVSVRVSTKTASKNLTGIATGYSGSTGAYQSMLTSTWMATAYASDTTTVWTSLGTISFPVAATGRITVRRIA